MSWAGPTMRHLLSIFLLIVSCSQQVARTRRHRARAPDLVAHSSIDRVPGVFLNFTPSPMPTVGTTGRIDRSYRIRDQKPGGIHEEARSPGHQTGSSLHQGAAAWHRDRVHQRSLGNEYRNDGRARRRQVGYCRNGRSWVTSPYGDRPRGRRLWPELCCPALRSSCNGEPCGVVYPNQIVIETRLTRATRPMRNIDHKLMKFFCF
jgi:hypothetical protein